MKKIIKRAQLLLVTAFLGSFISVNASETLIIGFFNGLGDDVTFEAPTNAVCIEGCTDDDTDYTIYDKTSTSCASTVTIPANGTDMAFSIKASEHVGGCHWDSDPSSFTATATISDGTQLTFNFTYDKAKAQWSVSGPQTIGGEWNNRPVIYDSPSTNSCSEGPSILAGPAVNDASACVNIYLGYKPSELAVKHEKAKASKAHDQEHKIAKVVK